MAWSSFDNVFPSIKTIPFKLLLHHTSNVCLKLTFFIILTNFSFSLFVGTEEVEECGGVEEICSMPGVKGTTGAGDGCGGYPCELASGPHGCQEPWS